MAMQADPLCPACTEVGRLVGRDGKGREFFACRTAGCDVVEYDRDVIRVRGVMQSNPLCPSCTEVGRVVGLDSRGRKLFACRTDGCDVVEYDRDIVRVREGMAPIRGPLDTRRVGRGQPSWWTR